MSNENRGLWYVLTAYTIWGLIPGYWTLLSSVDPREVLAHRIIWSAVFLGAILITKGNLLKALRSFFQMKERKTVFISAALLCGNWLLYVWAIGHHYIMESGLGYYLCPLFSIALGRLVLNERLTSLQKIAVGLVCIGVIGKLIVSGHLPWIAIGLALSFSLYTLIRKSARLDPIEGIFFEMIVAALPALLYLGYLGTTGNSEFINRGFQMDLLLAASGIITAFPLLLLATGAPFIPLQLTGVLQFIAPTLTMTIGYFLGDTIPSGDLPSYLFIWAGVLVFIAPGLRGPIARVNIGNLSRLYRVKNY